MRLIPSEPIEAIRFNVENSSTEHFMRCKYVDDPDAHAGWYSWAETGWESVVIVGMAQGLEAAYQETLKESVK